MADEELLRRLEALEGERFSEDERDLLHFLIKAVKAARGTIWLTNGFIKYVLPILGVVWGLWHWGTDALAWMKLR